MRSPSKDLNEDLSPGLRTPNDASPEHSVSTPAIDGERESAHKRTRDGADTEAEGEREASSGRARRSSARAASSHARFAFIKAHVKEVCGALAGLISMLKLGVLSDEVRERLDAQASALRGDLDVLEREVRDLRSTDAVWESLLSYITFARAKSIPTAKFANLSNDVLHLALRAFLEVGSIKELLAMSSVNKQMRDAIRNPMVWRTLDLREYKSSITDRNLSGIVRDDDAFTCLENLNMQGCLRLTDRSVLKVLRKCHTSVRHIDLTGCENLTTDTLRYIMSECKHVQSLFLNGCSQISAAYFFEHFYESPECLKSVKINKTLGLDGRVDENDFNVLHTAVKGFVDRCEAAFDDIKSFEAFMEVFEVAGSDVVEVCHLVIHCGEYLRDWKRGNSVAACDHAHSIQNIGSGRNDPVLTLFPECGHVSCVDCTLSERRNMRVLDGQYTYPCAMCRDPMPAPGGFEIVVRSERQAPRRAPL